MNEELYRINQKSETWDLVKFHLCGITFPDRTYMIRRPSSPVWCIEYVEEGRGTVHMGGETFFPEAGDSYFLHAGRDHYYYSDAEDPWKKRFVNISGRLVDSLVEGYGLSRAFHFPGLCLREELGEIIGIARRGEMDNTPLIIAALNRIFFKMHAGLKRESAPSPLGVQMKDFLGTQITEEFRISRLCKHISKSESQTIRLFKKEFGQTPYAYVLEKKLDFAQKLLIDTNLSVKEIALKLCFSDEYYFSNLFKEKTGHTPSGYRKKSR